MDPRLFYAAQRGAIGVTVVNAVLTADMAVIDVGVSIGRASRQRARL